MSDGHASAATFYGTFTAIILIIVGFVFFDLMLVQVDRNEREQEAERYFNTGKQEAAAGDYNDAVDNFRTAFSINRENVQAQLSFAQALYNAGRMAEAEATARDILQKDPTNADTSLIMARILVKQPENKEEGVLFYHRAIYGRWAEDESSENATPEERQLQTRLELTDVLARSGDDEELLAELLPLRDEAGDDIRLLHQIAPLYIEAGAPARAAELYNEITTKEPQDAEAWAGLGDAEFAQANYRLAERQFQKALKLEPDNASIQHRLDVTQQILALDPLGRELSSLERYNRSVMLLQMAYDSLMACAGAEPSFATRTFYGEGRGALARKVAANERNDAVDENLNLSEQIWDTRIQVCGQPPASEEPISLVLSRAAQ